MRIFPPIWHSGKDKIICIVKRPMVARSLEREEEG